MPSYKFKYFNARGFGEVSRLLFALAGQEYEDARFTQETWPAEKPNTPFGQMPVLEVDGKQYGQSSAIARYLARTFGFYGKNDLEALQIDTVLGIIQDIINVLIKVFYEKDEAKKTELSQEASNEKIPNYMRMFEKILKDNGGNGYCVGDKFSLADVALFDCCEKVQVFVKFDDYPLVKKCRDMVGADPKIKAWLAKRPVTEN